MEFLVFCLSLLTIFALADECNCSCSFNYTKPRGILTSPKYPDSYPSEITCIYRITLPPGQIVSLSISDIDLGWNETDLSSMDHLSIFDGDNEIFPRIDVLYGSNYFSPVRTYNSTTNQLLLQFKTFSNPGVFSGFHATYQAIDRECGGLTRSDQGLIQHPLTGTYKNNETCDWIIQAPPGHVIRLRCETMSVGDGDYLIIKEWQNTNFVDIAAYTGMHSGAMQLQLFSNGPIVYMKFTSQNNQVYRGFRMFYEFVDLSNSTEVEPVVT